MTGTPLRPNTQSRPRSLGRRIANWGERHIAGVHDRMSERWGYWWTIPSTLLIWPVWVAGASISMAVCVIPFALFLPPDMIGLSVVGAVPGLFLVSAFASALLGQTWGLFWIEDRLMGLLTGQR